MKKSIFTSSFLAVIMLLFVSTFVVALNVSNPGMFASSSLWAIFLIFTTFMIYRTGKISKYRSVFFIIFAFSFVLVFVGNLLEERGSMALTQEIIQANETPLCPVAIPMLILPAIFKHLLIFPTKLVGGTFGGFYQILLLWLVGLLVLGRGWCSWGCFYGGIDEGFSKIGKKKIISVKKINPKLRMIPFAVLIVITFWAFIEMEPVYCEWLCPLKLVTEYVEINSLVTYLQSIIFITLGMGLLIILPILTGKRTHCSLFCPLGAFQSITGKVNPFRVVIDKDKCIECGLCQRVCPMFAITDEHLKKKKVGLTCSRCGKCIDACPQGAISFKLIGVPASLKNKTLSTKIAARKKTIGNRILARLVFFVEELFEPGTLYIFGALLFGAILSGSMVPEALYRIYRLFSAGTLLLGG